MLEAPHIVPTGKLRPRCWPTFFDPQHVGTTCCVPRKPSQHVGTVCGQLYLRQTVTSRCKDNPVNNVPTINHNSAEWQCSVVLSFRLKRESGISGVTKTAWICKLQCFEDATRWFICVTLSEELLRYSEALRVDTSRVVINFRKGLLISLDT